MCSVCTLQLLAGESVSEHSPAVQGCAVNAMALFRLEEPLELLSLVNQPMHIATTVEHTFVVPGNLAAQLCANAVGGMCNICEIELYELRIGM